MTTQLKFLTGALMLLMLLEIVPVFFGTEFQEWQERRGASQAAETLKLSDFKGSASIGGPAAMVLNDSNVIRELSWCAGLPESAFVLLFLAFVLLLGFNLQASYRANGYPGGVFEIILTALFIGIAVYFDECDTAPWFPLLVLKVGLILFILAVLTLPYTESQKNPQDATLF